MNYAITLTNPAQHTYHACFKRRKLTQLHNILTMLHAPELKEANQMLSLQTGLRILKRAFELRNELPNFATKFGILQ